MTELEEIHRMRLEKLERMMSEISEQCWAAGWLIGNEHALFRMAFRGGSRRYGMSEVRMADVDELRRLANATSCWMVWGEHGVEAVPLEQFAAMIPERAA